jgi:hypothetical protein
MDGKQAVDGKVQIAAIIGGDEDQLVKLPLTVKVYEKVPTLKLSKTSATLNKDIGAGKDPFVVDVITTPSDYDIGTLDIKVYDKSGKVEKPGELTVEQSGSKITVNTNANTQAGETYKVMVGLQNAEGAKPVAFTAKIIAATKGTASVTLSAKGSIDTARLYAGSIVLTPKYKNFNGFGEVVNTFTVTAVNTKVKPQQTDDHTDRFEITENANGTYTLKVKDGKYLDASLKYSVVMTSSIASESSKPVNLTVKQGSIKVAQDVKAINLYRNDRYSEGIVTLSIADSTVMPIAKIKLKDADKSFFEVEELRDGRVVIGYKGDEINPKVKNGSAKLDVWLEGNDDTNPNAKPNASVTVSVKVVAFKNK